MPLVAEIQCLSAPPFIPYSIFVFVSSSYTSSSRCFPSATLESADTSIIFNMSIVPDHVKLTLYMFESPDNTIFTAVYTKMQLLLGLILVLFFKNKIWIKKTGNLLKRHNNLVPLISFCMRPFPV